MSRHMRALCRILCGVLVLYSLLVTPDSARVMADGPGPDCLSPTVFAESDFYPPSNRAAAEALLPVPPLNPIADVARVTPLPLTFVKVERQFEGVMVQAGQTAPVIGITYEFGSVPSTWPYFVFNDAPAFVTV